MRTRATCLILALLGACSEDPGGDVGDAGSDRASDVGRADRLADRSDGADGPRDRADVDPPPTGAIADPTLLPIASGQEPNHGAYAALDVPALSAGSAYLDPTTGVTVYRVTDARTPIANERGQPDYSDGGPFISLPWERDGDTHYTLYLAVRPVPSFHYLVDFDYTAGTFENWREAPVQGNEITFSFSNNPDTAQIAYYLEDRTLHRYDTGAMATADTGNFPHTFAIGREGDWLSVDMNDRWFVCQEEFDGGTVAVWNSETNVEHHGATGEPHMIRDGSFVMGAENRASDHEELTGHVVSNTALLNLATGELTRPDQPESHPAGAANGFFMAVDPNQGGGNQLYRFEAATGFETHLGGRGDIIGSSGHFAGQWVVNNEPGLDLWMLFSGWGGSSIVIDAIAFVPFNATSGNVRLLAHHYSSVGEDYYAQPHATLSPDGKLVLFGSNMNDSGRIDAFLAIVPAR